MSLMNAGYTLSAFRRIAGNPDTHSMSDDVQKMIERTIPKFDQINPSASFMFVYDFGRMKYLLVSDSVKQVTGYSAECWRDGGIDWVVTILYQEDVKRLTKLHAALFDFYYSIPVTQRKNCRYAYEYHLVHKDGRPIWLLQQGAFIEISPNGRPGITFDILTDITPFKRDRTMTLKMSTEDSNNWVLYFPIEGDISFSKREIEILKLISEGFKSREIGQKLCISSHTVDTHRRNMLKKTGHKDSTELIFYARQNALI